MLEHVFRPGRLGSLQLPHRIVMGAMHLGLESRSDGGAAMAAFYAERARSGAGLIVTGGSAVSRVGAGGRNYSFVNSSEDRPKLRRIACEVHEAGGVVALQLFHAGRYAYEASFGLQPVAPSAVYSRFSRCEPSALTESGIRSTVADFASGAAVAVELGFDAVEIMGSEGYLVDQFLSPLTNLRDDDWGGDSKRRMRFGLELLAAVRAAVGADFPIVFRFTGADLMPGGTPQEDVLAFAQALAAGGADALNVGVGWHESPVPTVQAVVPPGMWIPAAAAVKRAVGDVPVIASNRVNRLSQADVILGAGEVDFVSMARPFLADGELISRGRRGAAVNTCIACNQACIDRSLDDAPVSCLVNPRAGRELEFPSTVVDRRHVAVVGGGPAGLEAARSLAAAGHAVELFEASEELGGQFRLARRVPGKADYGATVSYFEAELKRLGVAVHCGVSPELSALRGFDGVIVATGVRPRVPDIPGAEHAIPYSSAFDQSVLGQRVAIIGGGGIAVDLAGFASRVEGADDFGVHYGFAVSVPAQGRRQVTILQRSKRTGARLGKSTRWAVLAELRHQGVRIVPETRYERITPDGVHIVDSDGAPALIEADTVVLACGQEREDGLADSLAGAGIWHRVIGGARDATALDAVRAFSEGAETVKESIPRV